MTEEELLILRRNFIATLREQRIAMRFTLTELASRCGLTLTALSRIEKGTTIPRLDTLVKIAAALGLKLEVAYL